MRLPLTSLSPDAKTALTPAGEQLAMQAVAAIIPMNVKAQIRKMSREEMKVVCARPSKMSYEEQVRSIQEGIKHRGAALPVPGRFKNLEKSPRA